MVSFVCPTCNQERTGARRRCYQCTIKPTAEHLESLRQSVIARHAKETPAQRREQSRRMREAVKNNFDIGALTRGKPSPRAKPVGYTRISNGHMQVKCADGKFRYRARVMWEEAYGPIPPGRLIHHKNENPFDDRLDNFQMVTRAQHAALHSTPDRMRAAQLLGVAARKRNRTY